MAPPEPSYPATESPGYPNETEAQEDNLQSGLTKLNKSIKEIRKTFEQIEALKD